MFDSIPVPKSGNAEELLGRIRELTYRTDEAAIAEFIRSLDISWIYHDGALEGSVYEKHELQAALAEEAITDKSLIPVYDEIRCYKTAIDHIRDLASKRRRKITLDMIKKIYVILDPEEAEGKGPPKYRKEMPLHRVYFHEIAQPSKISYRMRQLVQWLDSEDTRRTVHPVRMAAKAHSMLLHVFPFPKHSGKVARLLMNLLIMREGYPPVIIHSTDRQRYYDALKTSDDEVAALINDALNNSLASTYRYFMRLHGIPEETT